MAAPILVVGADRAPHGLADLTDRFGAAEWIDGSTRTVEKAERRVRAGTVAGVIVLDGYISHRLFGQILAAARLACVPFAYGGRGGKGALGMAANVLETEMRGRPRATGT